MFVAETGVLGLIAESGKHSFTVKVKKPRLIYDRAGWRELEGIENRRWAARVVGSGILGCCTVLCFMVQLHVARYWPR